jgi:hypothetical protein
MDIVDIELSDLVSNGPNVINQNFATVKSHVESLESILNPESSVLKLTDLLSIPNGGIESSSLALTLGAGLAFVINPGGNGNVMTVSTTGAISCKSVVTTDTSTFAGLVTTGLGVNGVFQMNGELDVSLINSVVKEKYTTYSISDANIGNDASNPIDLSKQKYVDFDYYNGGVNLGGDADVKLDMSNMVHKQIIRIQCFRTNGAGMSLNNGVSGNEVFAYIDPTQGYVTVSASTKPSFNPQSSPNNQSYLVCQYRNIGGGVYKLVILEAKNVSGVF